MSSGSESYIVNVINKELVQEQKKIQISQFLWLVLKSNIYIY